MKSHEQPSPSSASAPRQRIALQDLRFYAFHGYYPEEQVLGNEFFVDVTVTYMCQTSSSHTQNSEDASEDVDFLHTVNYEVLFQLVRQEMERPRRLLETVTHDIFAQIQSNFPYLDAILVRIRKSNPPFGGDHARAVVEINWDRSS